MQFYLRYFVLSYNKDIKFVVHLQQLCIMNEKKPKYLTEIEPFVNWFKQKPNTVRKNIRKKIMQDIWPDKPRSAWYNFLYGRTPLSHLLGREIATIVMQFDDSITAAEIFPTLTIEMMNNRIGYYLNQKGLSQNELANITGISRQLIGGYVAGKNVPNVYNAQLIADTLGVELKELFDLNEKRA